MPAAHRPRRSGAPTAPDPLDAALSAAFVLPWKGRNPDVAALREKRERNDFEMALQRRIVKERLQALLQAAEAFREQQARRDRLVPPLVDQLTRDLEQMQGAPFDQLRDQLQIRRRMLDTAIQAAVAMFHVRRGRWQPAQIMLRRALPRLRLFEPAWRGVDVRRLVSELERCSASLERLGPDRIAELSSGPFPRIRF